MECVSSFFSLKKPWRISFYISIDQGHGKIGGSDLSHCQTELYQNFDQILRVFFANFQTGFNPECVNSPFFRFQSGFGFLVAIMTFRLR